MRLPWLLGTALLAVVLTAGGVGPAAGASYPQVHRRTRKCPACALFALALRRVTYDTNPDPALRDAKKRKGKLNQDDRVMDVIAESIDVCLANFMLVLTNVTATGTTRRPARIVPFSPNPDDPDEEQAWVEEMGTFWPVRNLKLMKHLSEESLKNWEDKKSSGGDIELLNFLNGDLYTEFEEDVEKLAVTEFFPTAASAGEYYELPRGLNGGRDRFTDGSRDENRPLRLFADVAKEEASRREWVLGLCRPYCGTEIPPGAFPVEPQTPEEEAASLKKLEAEITQHAKLKELYEEGAKAKADLAAEMAAEDAAKKKGAATPGNPDTGASGEL